MADPVFRRLLSGAVFGLSLLGLGLGGAVPASADGSLAVSPARGADDTPMQVTTSGGCPSPATNVLARIYGPGFGRDGENVVGNTPLGGYDQPIVLPLSQTLRASAAAQTPPVTLHGVYTLVVSCRLPLKPASYTDYVSSIEFTTPHSYRLSPKHAALPARPRASPDPPGHATRTIAPATRPSRVDATPAGGRHGVDPLLVVLAGLGVVVVAAFGLQPVWSRRRAAAVSARTAVSAKTSAGKTTAAGGGTKRVASTATTTTAKAGTAKAGTAGTAPPAGARAADAAGPGKAATGTRPAIARRRANRPESIATAPPGAGAPPPAPAQAVAAAEAAAAEAEAAAAEAEAAGTAAAAARNRPTRPAGGSAKAGRDPAEPAGGDASSRGAPAGPTAKAGGARAGGKRH
jgi:hypothetical protein